MKQKINKLTVIIMCLLMVFSVISCAGKQAERDYSNVVVDEPLMFDPAKASLNGISLGMTAEEIMNSGIFSEGSLSHHKKGDYKSYDDDRNIVWEAPEIIFYDDTEFTDVNLCGKNADMEFMFKDGKLCYMNLSAMTNYLEEQIPYAELEAEQTKFVDGVESEFYRILGEPNMIEDVEWHENGVLWRYYIKDGKVLEGKIKSDLSYKEYEKLDFDYTLWMVLSKQDVADLESFIKGEDPFICSAFIAMYTKEHILNNTPR